MDLPHTKALTHLPTIVMTYFNLCVHNQLGIYICVYTIYNYIFIGHKTELQLSGKEGERIFWENN